MLDLVDDLKFDSADYTASNYIQNFFNIAFESWVIPVIYRPTRITKATVTVIDHILINTILDFEVQIVIMKNYKSDHFGIFCVVRTALERKNINECIL